MSSKMKRLVWLIIFIFFPVSTVYSFRLNVPYFPQGGDDAEWRNDPMGCGQPIGSKGCLITSISMVINYYIPDYTDPGIFNEWLISNNGYDSSCNYNWDLRLTKTYTEGLVTGDNRIDFNYEELDKELEEEHPVIAKVRNEKTTSHFVVLTGKENGRYLINDPGWDNKFLDAYIPLYMVFYNGPLYQWNFNQKDTDNLEKKFEDWKFWNNNAISTYGDIAVLADQDDPSRTCLIINPGIDPYLISPDLSFDASSYNAIVFEMKSEAKDCFGRIYYRNESMSYFDENHKIDFTVIKDGIFHPYLIYLGNCSGWQGNILNVRIDPVVNGNGSTDEEIRVGESDNIYIDYIKLINHPLPVYDSLQNGNFQEGTTGNAPNKWFCQIANSPALGEIKCISGDAYPNDTQYLFLFAKEKVECVQVVQTVKVEENKTYGLSGEYITDTPDGKAYAYIEYLYDSEHPFPSNGTFEKKLSYSPDNWSNFSFRGAAPKGARAARLYLRLWNAEKCAIKFDNLKFGTEVSGIVSTTMIGEVRIASEEDFLVENPPLENYPSVTDPVPDQNDITSPTIISKLPQTNTQNIAVSTNVIITFSEPMEQGATESAFSIAPFVSGAYMWINDTLTFNPTSSLDYNTTYTISINSQATDSAGNQLEQTSWSFTTLPCSPDVVELKAVYYVVPDKPSSQEEFSSISRAINEVFSKGGGAVIVKEGEYNEEIGIELKPGVMVIGAGKDKTIIRPLDEGYVVVGADNSLIAGFTITGGSIGINCGMNVTPSAPYIINNRIIENNTGIVLNNSSPIIIGNAISRNKTNGIECQNDSSPFIKNNLIVDNKSLNGVCVDNSSPIIINNIIASNKLCGIRARDSFQLLILNNIVFNNGYISINVPTNSNPIVNFNLVNPSNCDVCVLGKENILDKDPLFVDINNNDYRLQPISPAIDKGDPDSAYNDNSQTQQGNPRNDLGIYGGPDGIYYILPIADFSASSMEGESPLKVEFQNKSFGEITSYLWDFGDGSTSNEQSPTHTYTQIGYFDVILTVTGPGGSTRRIRQKYIHSIAPTVVPKPSIFVSPLIHDFGTVDTGDVSKQAVIIKNSGDADLLMESVSITGPDGLDFAIQSNNCIGEALGALEECTSEIEFFPKSSGSKHVNLTIRSNDPDTPVLNISLDGTATQQYTLMINSEGTGSGIVLSSPSGIDCGTESMNVYDSGTLVTLTAIPNLDSTFAGWIGGEYGGTGNYVTTINNNATVTAIFMKNSYTIITITDPQGIILPSGEITVYHGTNQTFTIIPGQGYQVADVVADGISVGPVTTYAFPNVTKNHIISVGFEIDNTSPIADAGPDQTVNEGVIVGDEVSIAIGEEPADEIPPAPTAPTLISPTNNSHQGNLTFQWSAVSDATQYELSILPPEKSERYKRQTDLTSYTDSPTMIEVGQFYWEVRALVNGEWSDYSNEWTFYYDGLMAPTLVSPANNSQISDLGTTFEWNPVSGTNFYELQIASDSDFNNFFKNIPDIEGTSWQLNCQDACEEQVYYWRVCASNANDPIGQWSDPWYFSIQDAQLPTPNPTGTIAVTTNNSKAAFTISGPATYNGASNNTGTPWIEIDVPVGTYSITFHPIPEYITPSDTLKTLTDGSTISFNGIYQEEVAQLSLENPPLENYPPIANAGPDQTVNEGSVVNLDGSNSSDPDSNNISYLWTQIPEISVTLSNALSDQPTFTAPEVGISGDTLSFKLTATDLEGLFSSDNVIINIKNFPKLPIADAGPDQTVVEGKTVTLDGFNSSDPDGYDISYLWEQIDGPAVILSNSTAVKPTFFTPAVDPAGMMITFQLTVKNSADLKASDEVSIAIDDNGITDLWLPINAISLRSFGDRHIGIKVNDGGNIVRLDVVNPDTISRFTNRPKDLIYGLIDIHIKVDTSSDAATVTIYFPEPAPDGYQWYKYSSQEGWNVYDSDHAKFNDDRTQVTITLVDGGIGDDDGLKNGIIVDPSGLGVIPDPKDNPATTANCFITAINF